MTATIRVATPDEWDAIKHLLAQAGLPTDDLSNFARPYFIVCAEDTQIKGVIALEPLASQCGMLRSLVVAPDARSQRIGHVLVESVEALARSQQMAEVFLLTTSADGFFSRMGYERLARESAPECVKAHAQFRTLCPASAVVMTKRM
jgi:amino-acid N-acetyltransferase